MEKNQGLFLYNRVSGEELKKRLHKEVFKRVTLSFYRYFKISDPFGFRDSIFSKWFEISCFGRIYVAHEGINAQMSVPRHHLGQFLKTLEEIKGLENMPIKYAIDDDGKSFYKLTIKVREKIVADGLPEDSYDVSDVGTHLSPIEFHTKMQEKDTVVVDMRNHYESEVGRFENAFCPDADTFRDAIKMVEKEFEGQKDKKFLLYCTGGIRCEKASSYLKHKGFKNVGQLYGGIIAYAHEIKKAGMASKFTGKNFVFDERLGESIDGKVIAHCHQCGAPCDTHTNCAHNDCHLLFIQCPGCRDKYAGCCSSDCQQIVALAPEQKALYKILRKEKYAGSKIYKSRLRPKLKGRIKEGRLGHG
jgi:UPF0176 protein